MLEIVKKIDILLKYNFYYNHVPKANTYFESKSCLISNENI